MKVFETSLVYKQIGEIDSEKLDCPQLVINYCRPIFECNPYQEQFMVLFLNRKNNLVGVNPITMGTLDSSLVHPREVFRAAIQANAAAIIVTHNHPSGDPTPSGADTNVTNRLSEAAKILGIDFLDHIVLGDKNEDPKKIGYFSYSEHNLI